MAWPVCHQDTDPKDRPFRTRRCADVDLGRWLTGAYAIPAKSEDPPDEDDAEAAQGRPH